MSLKFNQKHSQHTKHNSPTFKRRIREPSNVNRIKALNLSLINVGLKMLL